MKSRIPFALAALAILPFAMTGCSGSGDKSDAKSESATAATSPEASCAKLEKSLNELSARIRDVDASLTSLVGDAVTDPTDRNEAFLKSLKKVNTAPVKAALDDVTRVSAELVAAWEKSAASLNDAGARVAAEANRDDAKARNAELIAALRQVDTAIAAHKKLVREIRVVLSDKPGSEQIVRARPAARGQAQLAARVRSAIATALSATGRLGKLPVPAVIEPVEESKPIAPDKGESLEHAEHQKDPATEEKTSEPTAPGVKTEPAAALATPAPAAPAATPAAEPAAEPKLVAPKEAPAPAPAPTPAPTPTPAAPVADPVPEPVEA